MLWMMTELFSSKDTHTHFLFLLIFFIIIIILLKKLQKP